MARLFKVTLCLLEVIEKIVTNPNLSALLVSGHSETLLLEHHSATNQGLNKHE